LLCLCKPGTAAAAVDQQLLDWLCEVYAAAAAISPRMSVIPTLSCAGWTTGDRWQQLFKKQQSASSEGLVMLDIIIHIATCKQEMSNPSSTYGLPTAWLSLMLLAVVVGRVGACCCLHHFSPLLHWQRLFMSEPYTAALT
jgi:hypothetical protein